jgi:hypothetical protein
MERVNLPSKIHLSKLIFLAGELFSWDRCQMKRVKSYGNSLIEQLSTDKDNRLNTVQDIRSCLLAKRIGGSPG